VKSGEALCVVVVAAEVVVVLWRDDGG